MSTKPSVTVIMPIRNEGAFIDRSLGAVVDQDFPRERLQILVADGRSTDDTRARIQDLARKHPEVTIEIVDNPGGIVPTGMNAALRKATGDIIVRVDGHTIVERDYIRRCLDALERTGAQCVGGRMDAVADAALGRAVALATSSPFGVGGARFHYSPREEEVDTVYMGAWPRELFQRMGGFDEEMVRNQDDELSYRIRERGGRIMLDPSIKSRYYPRTSLRTLWRQYFQYGYWKVRVMQKHPLQMKLRHFAPGALVATLAVTALASPFSAAARVALVTVASLYVAANLAASAWTARRADEGSAPWLPVVFAALHLSYGAGFLTGLVRFAGRFGQRPAEATS
ncbi:MAG TPA: glycosyltransferase family 2 protein [Candidatus Eisenbacteria bacterium]|nr:glycosyltransferase family 2 protein [Candidatus Eisenbacteria bacterium]